MEGIKALIESHPVFFVTFGAAVGLGVFLSAVCPTVLPYPEDLFTGYTEEDLKVLPKTAIEEMRVDWEVEADLYLDALIDSQAWWSGPAYSIGIIYVGTVVILVSAGCFYLWWTDTPVGVTEVADVAEVSAQVIS